MNNLTSIANNQSYRQKPRPVILIRAPTNGKLEDGQNVRIALTFLAIKLAMSRAAESHVTGKKNRWGLMMTNALIPMVRNHQLSVSAAQNVQINAVENA